MLVHLLPQKPLPTYLVQRASISNQLMDSEVIREANISKQNLGFRNCGVSQLALHIYSSSECCVKRERSHHAARDVGMIANGLSMAAQSVGHDAAFADKTVFK